MRIQKYLSQQGILSRREAEAHIRAGKIKLNGKIVREMGVQIDPEKDKVEVLSVGGPAKRTLAFYKPRGLETEAIVETTPEFSDLHPVGRLDKESEGLILLSNDGIITKAVTSDQHLVAKEYLVRTQERITAGKIRKMEEGVRLEDGLTLPAEVELISPYVFRLILKEGRKHQIRRMAAALNLTIVGLKRTRVGNIRLGSLSPGRFRALSPSDCETLKKELR